MATESRPAIPKELERKILIEAGHRCAIHTCRHADVTIHHIVPWSKVHEHSYENMIALCPNCHKMADRGEIDRKSLFTYKANLQRLFNGIPKAVNSNGVSAWKTEVIEESLLEEPGFDIKIEFPFFSNEFSSSMDRVNNLVESTIYSNLHWLRKLHAERIKTQDKGIVDFGGSYEVTLLNNKMLSVRFNFYQYTPFAAHPIHSTVPINCRLQRMFPLQKNVTT